MKAGYFQSIDSTHEHMNTIVKVPSNQTGGSATAHQWWSDYSADSHLHPDEASPWRHGECPKRVSVYQYEGSCDLFL